MAYAAKYKKMEDFKLAKAAARHVTPEEREAQLAAAGAPLDVMPAEVWAA